MKYRVKVKTIFSGHDEEDYTGKIHDNIREAFEELKEAENDVYVHHVRLERIEE